MREVPTFVRLLGAGTAAAMLLGALVVAQPAKAGIVIHPAHMVNPFVKNHCDAHGGVRVDPCSVDFNASNPGPFVVTVRMEKAKKGTLVESDNCAGIATVVDQGSGNWLVSAGSNPGSCTATFAFINHHGKQVGYGNLSITNEL